MRELVRKKQAPKGAVCPQPIPDGGLWKLDVDDNIWQDIGLEDTSSEHEPPPWLKDEQTRLGIRHMLDYDRVVEEQKRVLREHIGLQESAREEWNAIQIAKEDTSTSSLSIGTCAHAVRRRRGHDIPARAAGTRVMSHVLLLASKHCRYSCW